MMRKQWKMILCVLLAVLLGGVLALCLWEREPQGDTDPNAPFVDLPARTKKEVLEAIIEYWNESPRPGPSKVQWHEKTSQYNEKWDGNRWEHYYAHNYGLRYYGTFNGYHIIMCPLDSQLHLDWGVGIAGYGFVYLDSFELFAYKNGVVVPLKEVYVKGQLNDESIGKIHQCYERYNEEVYVVGG